MVFAVSPVYKRNHHCLRITIVMKFMEAKKKNLKEHLEISTGLNPLKKGCPRVLRSSYAYPDVAQGGNSNKTRYKNLVSELYDDQREERKARDGREWKVRKKFEKKNNTGFFRTL